MPGTNIGHWTRGLHYLFFFNNFREGNVTVNVISIICMFCVLYVRCNQSIKLFNDNDRMIKVSYFFFVVTLLLQASAPLLMSPRMFLPARCLACSSAWSERGRVRSPQSPSHTQPVIRCAWQPGSLLGLVIR